MRGGKALIGLGYDSAYLQSNGDGISYFSVSCSFVGCACSSGFSSVGDRPKVMIRFGEGGLGVCYVSSLSGSSC